MSLYNAVFGTNVLAGTLLTILELRPHEVGRFRDCYLDISDEQNPKIVVLTRTGGNNRSDYVEENKRLQEHKLYLSDRDDDFDNTYALFYFSLPTEHAPLLEICKGIGAEQSSLKERTEKLLEQLKSGYDKSV